MYCEGILPDIITFVYALKSCGSLGATKRGRKLHAELERQGLLDRELVIGNTLIQMYADCDSLAIAQQVFDKLSSRNAVSWNVLIGGYAEHGHGEEALMCFEEMQIEGVSPSPFTFICSLKACASTGLTEWGRELHSKIERQGLFDGDIVVGNSLVTMYAKCGFLERARHVFANLGCDFMECLNDRLCRTLRLNILKWFSR
ncbi:hypothetical protein L7F22_038593 [Adiantum nelumboides]|nr:hypothetical protein [Adiantum nelumboides]